MTWLGILILVAAPPLCIFGLQMVCAPRSTSVVLARGLNALGNAVYSRWADIRDGIQDTWPFPIESYDQLCRKYADTLPAFSDETKRIMRREGHWPEPRRNKDFFGHHGVVSGIWDDLPHYGPKAPGLMRVWPKDYPPSTVTFQGYDRIASVKPNNETEAMRQMKVLQDMARNLSSARVDIKYGSHPMDKPSYAPRIVREVVEVEEIEITTKSSAEVKVEGFERRYYQPIEEPDVSRILLDKT